MWDKVTWRYVFAIVRKKQWIFHSYGCTEKKSKCSNVNTDFAHLKMINALKNHKWRWSGTCRTKSGDVGHMQRTSLETTHSNRNKRKRKCFTEIIHWRFPRCFFKFFEKQIFSQDVLCLVQRALYFVAIGCLQYCSLYVP